MTYTNHAPLIPLFAVELGLSDVQAGLLTTALFLASTPAYLVGGGLPERFGVRRMNAIGIALALAGNALFAAAPSYEWLLLAKGVSGVGSGIAFNATTTYIAGLYGPARSHFGLGVVGAGYPFGAAIAIWLMPVLALPLGWRAAFWASSLAIAAALLVWLAAPRPLETRPRGTLLDALRCGNCWWVSLQHAAGFGLGLAAGTWVTVYLLREFALPLDVSALFGSLLLALTVVARPVGGYLMSREHVASRVVMRIAQLAILVGLAALATPDRPLALALVGAVAVGFGAGFPYAAVFNTAAASLQRAPGSAQGFAAFGGTTGALVGAPVIGYAVQTWGFSAAWLGLATLSTVALAATFVMQGEEDQPA